MLPRQPIIFLSNEDHIERLSLALEIQREFPGLSLFLAWAEAGKLETELRALAVVWDWEAYNAGNREAL